MALVHEIDSQVKDRNLALDQEFDILNLKHRHEEWLDGYHQKVARIEMELREKESQIPAIRNQILEHERLIENYNESLRQSYGERLDSMTQSQNMGQKTLSNDLDKVVFEGWLVEVGRSQIRKYFKLVPATPTSVVRLYGFESDLSRTPNSIIQIPRKSTVAHNSITKDSAVSATLSIILPLFFAVLFSLEDRRTK